MPVLCAGIFFGAEKGRSGTGREAGLGHASTSRSGAIRRMGRSYNPYHTSCAPRCLGDLSIIKKCRDDAQESSVPGEQGGSRGMAGINAPCLTIVSSGGCDEKHEV